MRDTHKVGGVAYNGGGSGCDGTSCTLGVE